MPTELLLDFDSVPWVEPLRTERQGGAFLLKFLARGEHGASAVFSIQPDGFVNPAHLHSQPQFQLLLEGTVTFPAQQALTPVAVHYTDAFTPYGPFRVGPEFVVAALRNGPTEQFYVTDTSIRRSRRTLARERYGHAPPRLSEAGFGCDQVLFADPDGLEARFTTHRPHEVTPARVPRCGAFEVVVDGSALADGCVIARHSMRFVRGETAPSPLVAGTDGLAVLTLTFPSPSEIDP